MLELPPGEALPVYVIARILCVHRTHVLNWIDSGELKAIDLRGSQSSRSTVRVERQSLVKFLESRQIIVVEPKKQKGE